MAAGLRGSSDSVVPTRAGTDLEKSDKTIDGHIRIETYRYNGTNIYVDLFDSNMEDASLAHITSEMFPCTRNGASEATRFLQEEGFRVEVVLKKQDR